MPRVGFEPTIPGLEGAKTGHVLDCAVTVIGHGWNTDYPKIFRLLSLVQSKQLPICKLKLVHDSFHHTFSN
jgi:hypothetical protein